MNDLNKATPANLEKAESVAEIAAREGWDSRLYALGLSDAIRNDGLSLHAQLGRLQALANIGGGLDGARASADELAAHFLVLDALFVRLALMAARAAGQPGRPNAEAANQLAAGAIRAQRASVAVLGALRELRDDAAKTETAQVFDPLPSPNSDGASASDPD